MRLRRKAINGVFRSWARINHHLEVFRRASAGVEVIRNIDYGPYLYNRLDIYRPEFAARPLPVMLYIHGGGFVLCSKETHRGLAQAHAVHGGYLVFNIDYRLAPRFRFPAAHEDACTAYRWVAENCARFGGDPARIVVAGESAGGNLALAVGVAASYRRPEKWAQAVYDAPVRPLAIQPIMPYLQVSNPARHSFSNSAGVFSLGVAHDLATAYLGPGRTQAASATLMADPIRVLEECGAPQRPFPAMWAGVGTNDLCHDDVRRLEAVCERLSIPATFRYYENEVHAFHALRWRAAAKRFWADSFEFLGAQAAPVAVQS
ncbi:MAG TPA: alpha/beta hydrolase fold domain-containing protein [Solimonas sp.]|nr:alpha/beta hydrolase fold domain-containing protein [Solimonas sp.]